MHTLESISTFLNLINGFIVIFLVNRLKGKKVESEMEKLSGSCMQEVFRFRKQLT